MTKMIKMTKRIVQTVMTLIILSQGIYGFSILFQTKPFGFNEISLGLTLLGMLALGFWWIWFCAPKADDENDE